MNSVIYYSKSGESLKIAKYLSSKSNYLLQELGKQDNYLFENLIIVFPVYCQNVPKDVKSFLAKVRAENVSIIATYGKKSFGNVIYEASKISRLNIISYAYVPTKHTYIEDDDSFSDFERLDCLIEKFNTPTSIKIRRYLKNPFANIFEKIHACLNIKIIKSGDCDGCNICGKSCLFIEKGVVNGKCIGCLKCVNKCPKKALKVRKSLFLKIYLHIVRKNKLIIRL